MKLNEVDLRDRRNNLTLVRALAAISVVFGHSFVLFSGEPQQIWAGTTNTSLFGLLAVAVFFGLSGFLITQSFFFSKSWSAFLEARVLRIIPGLLFANVITAILLVSLFLPPTSEVLKSALTYIGRSTIFKLENFAGVFDTNPSHGVNGSLWTLSYEFRFYVYTLLLGLAGVLKKRTVFLALVLAVICVACFEIPALVNGLEWFQTAFKLPMVNREASYLSLTINFVLGILFYIYRDKVRLSIPLAAALLVGALFTTSWLYLILAWVYAAFVFALHPRLYVPKVDRWWDCSYGIYILSFPIQQSLVKLKIASDGYSLFAMTLVILLPLAAFSWKAIEEPALQLKGKLRFKSRRKADADS